MSTGTEVKTVGDVLKMEADDAYSREQWDIAAADQGVLARGDIVEVSGTDMTVVTTAGNAAGVMLDALDAALVAAEGVLRVTVNPANTKTVVIGAKTYTFQTSLTDVDGNVFIGADIDASLDNLIAAITLGAGAGTEYATSMTVHPTVLAMVETGSAMRVKALASGTGGNAIATTETLTNGAWDAATLEGGQGVLAASGIFAVRHCVVAQEQLNYNALTVATVNTALKALGIIVRNQA